MGGRGFRVPVRVRALQFKLERLSDSLYCRFICTSRLLSFAKQLSSVESLGSAYNGRLGDDVGNVEEMLSEFSDFNKEGSHFKMSDKSIYTAQSMELLYMCGWFPDLGSPHGTHGNFFGRQSIVF